ncbi:MAG: A/G-specific adenine glycosylase [Gammaproteobacteria bacterium]|nr:A/G-specific adenine glycosylase [Gammaproteobacteria bacterium]
MTATNAAPAAPEVSPPPETSPVPPEVSPPPEVSAEIPAEIPAKISARLLKWYDAHGRKDLPWQRAREPYRVWVAEVMLQQTQVGAVIPYYRRFMRQFPDLGALAAADLDAVLRHWAGLGYYARARNLHAAARQIVARHGGEFPARFEDIAALPGIGRSTAGAVAAFAFGKRRAILDGNVKRVLSRYAALGGRPGAAKTQAQLWQVAEQQLPKSRVADYNQALMDLGATVCARAKPKCDACPLAADCRAHRSGDPAAYPARKSGAVTGATVTGKPARRRKTVTMLIVRDRVGHVLLVQRPPRGIWGGLWSLPEYPHRAARPAATVARSQPSPPAKPPRSQPSSPAKPSRSQPSPRAKPRPPTPAQRRRIETWCARQLNLRVQTGRALPAFTHSFTHFDLDIRPLLADAPAGNPAPRMDGAPHLWYNPSKPATVGVPAAVARIFERLKVAPE